MTDRTEPLASEGPPGSGDAPSGVDDRPEHGTAPRRRTLYRVIGAVAVLVFLVAATPLILLTIATSSLECAYGSTNGKCSDATQVFVWLLFVGGVLVGLVCTAVAIVSARRASPNRWELALLLAAAVPSVCMAVASYIAAG